MKHILSIQSAVAYGHAGNSAATFPLMRMGVDVWPVLTVNFSNHTGYGSWRGPLIDPADVAEVVKGIDERGVLTKADAVLTGYQGAETTGAVILDAVALVKSRNPKAIYCCDPVMGDVDRGFYVRPGIPEFMRDQVVPATDVMTPNHFELNFLTGHESRTMDEVLAAADRLRELGPSTVLVTSVVTDDADADSLTMVAVSEAGAWRVVTPLLHRTFTGSGDLTTATFLTHLLQTGDLAATLSATASIVYSVLKVTADSSESELQLVAAQDNLVAPAFTFTAERIR